MRALIVRFSAIGDCVMAVPVAAAIRRAYPQGTLVWGIESRCAPVVDTTRLVTRRHVFPRDDWKARRWSPAVWREQLASYTALRRERFDIGIDLQGHSKTALCLRLAKPRRRIAAYATDWLAARLNPVIQNGSEPGHTIEWGMRVLNHLGDFGSDIEFVMPPPLPSPIGSSKPLATISVGAGRPGKTYPLECWSTVAQGLLEEGLIVAWLGGPGERAPEVPGAIDLVDRLSLAESMGAVSASAVHLAADTGSGHIAAAYGIPVVSIFGRTRPDKYRPWTSRGIVLRESRNPADVRPEQVVSAALELLKTYGPLSD